VDFELLSSPTIGCRDCLGTQQVMATSIFDTIIDGGVEIVSKGMRKRIGVTRLILATVENLDYMVLTPEGDIELETFGAEGVQYAIRDKPERTLPRTLGRLTSDFDPVPSSDELEDTIGRAERKQRKYELLGLNAQEKQQLQQQQHQGLSLGG
jgi:hypothetical protein